MRANQDWNKHHSHNDQSAYRKKDIEKSIPCQAWTVHCGQRMFFGFLHRHDHDLTAAGPERLPYDVVDENRYLYPGAPGFGVNKLNGEIFVGYPLPLGSVFSGTLDCQFGA
jgi:hypothetical protein